MFTVRNLLLVTAAALLVALGVETEWGGLLGTPQVQARTGGTKQDVVSVLPDFRLSPEAGAYGQIAERPLLNPSRRPAPTQAVVLAPEPPKPQVRRGLYQLIGITDLGSVKIAQVKEVASNRVKSVREGDLLQEMTVTKVGSTQVTLAFQGETDVIEMAKFTASGRVPQPPPPPPQPVAQAAPPPQPGQVPVPQAPQPTPVNAAVPPVAAVAGQPAPAAQRVFPNGLVATDTPTDQPRQVMNVVEMLERRRLARQQAGGQ
jgi:hypothetical protein